MRLESGIELARKISSRESHDYELSMEADQIVKIVAYQVGVDIAVALRAPDGEFVLEVDSPTGRQGPERLLAVAETAGIYRVVVRTVEEDAPTGTYRLIVKELRPASPEDRRQATAELRFSRAEALLLEGSMDSLRAAIEPYQEARAVWRGLGDRQREADVQLRLGWVYRDLHENSDAIACLEEASESYRDIGDRSGEGAALNSLGGVWIRLRENREALPLIEQAVGIATKIGDKLIIAESLNNLGIVLKRLGKTDEAIEAYTRARECYEELGDPRNLARIDSNIGILLLQQGKLQSATDYLSEAAEIWHKAGQLGQAAIALTALGDVRKRQGRFDEALYHLEKALSLRRQAEDREGEARTLNFLGTTHLLLREFERARDLYVKALAVFEEIGIAHDQAVTLVNLGRLHLETGDPQGARDLHRQALPLIARSDDQTLEASNFYGMARALHDLGDFEAARHHLERSLDTVEGLRVETRSEGLRIAFFATRQHYYELYVDILMHLQDEAGAFAAAEKRRARALLEALGEQVDGIRQHASPELLERESALQAELNDLERRRVVRLRDRTSDEGEITEISKKQRATIVELETVRGKLQRELVRPRPSSLAEIQALLAPGRFLGTGGPLLLVYSLGDERSFLWRVSHNELKSFILPPRREIEEMAVEAHRLLTSRDPGDEQIRAGVLADVSETLLGPVASELHDQRLLIVAEGALLQLPFAALPGPPGMESAPDYLVRRHETVYLPSVSLLRAVWEQLIDRYPAHRQLAIFADPVYVGRDSSVDESGPGDECKDKDLQSSLRALSWFGPLPHTRDEADAILQIARGDVTPALGYEATKKRVLQGELGHYKILHFATHGMIHREQPELSGLVLSLFDEQGKSLDGFLRLHEIYNLNLSAEMVVLSACQTGAGHNVRGEGILGLTRGFMYAGAPRLVVSLWSVADLGTAELMKRFYWNLLEGNAPPALALRAAQRSMLMEEEWGHPYYWAGFVFQGAWWPPGEEPPIGQTHAGGVVEDPSDPDYPGRDYLVPPVATSELAQQALEARRNLKEERGLRWSRERDFRNRGPDRCFRPILGSTSRSRSRHLI